MSTEQPLPTEPQPGVPCVQDQLVNYLSEGHVLLNPRTLHTLVQEIDARRDHGIATYGRALFPHNGRDALRDAFEEALDLVMYLFQLDLEWNAVEAKQGTYIYDTFPNPADSASPWSEVFRNAMQVLTSLVVLEHLRSDKS